MVVRRRRKVESGKPAEGPAVLPLVAYDDQGDGELQGHALSSFQQVNHDWLIPGRLAFGTLSIIAGAKGAGKSTLAACLAAHLSGGRAKLPGQKGPIRGKTVWITSEENPGSQIMPRILAHGGRPDQIIILGRDPRGRRARLPIFPGEWDAVAELIERNGARFLLIDGIASMTRPGLNLCSESDARELLDPAEELSERLSCLTTVIRHNRKSQTGSITDQVLGGVGVTGPARSVLSVRKLGTEAGARAILTESNLGPETAPLLFQIASKKGAGIVIWEGECAVDDKRIVDAQPDAGKLLQGASAEDYVVAVLRRGPAKAKDIFAAAGKEGYTWDALWRAARRIGVKIRRKGFGSEGFSLWSLQREAP